MMLVLPSLALLVSLDPALTSQAPARIIDPAFTNPVDDQMLARASASMAPPHLSLSAFAAQDTHAHGESSWLNRQALQDDSTIIDVRSQETELPHYASMLTGDGLFQYGSTVISDGGIASVSISLQIGTLQFRELSNAAL